MAGDSPLSRIREWMDTPRGKWTITLGALGVLVLAIATWLFGPGDTVAERERLRAAGRKVLYYCRACKAAGKMTLRINSEHPGQFADQFPAACPQCDHKQAVLGLKCVKCRKIFEKPPAGQRLYHCPHCDHKYDLRIGG